MTSITVDDLFRLAFPFSNGKGNESNFTISTAHHFRVDILVVF